MSLITLSIKHGQTQDEARNRLEAAVSEVRKLFGEIRQPGVRWGGDSEPMLRPNARQRRYG